MLSNDRHEAVFRGWRLAAGWSSPTPIELHEAEEDLVVSVHGLDAAIRTKVLVHLPTELGVDLPSQRAIREFCDRDDYGYDECEDVDGDVRYAGSSSWQGLLDFLNLNDGIYKEKGVEDAGVWHIRIPVAREVIKYAYDKNKNCSVFRAATASTARTNWNTLRRIVKLMRKSDREA